MPCASSPLLRMHSLAQKGFAIIPDVFYDTEVATLLCEIENAECAAKPCRLAPRDADRCSRRIRSPSAAAQPRVRGAPFRATRFAKSPDSNWLVGWHQDTAVPLRERHNLPGWGPWSVKEGILHSQAPAEVLNHVLALRIHLDDSTAQNGCVRVIPGTHTLGVFTDQQVEVLTQNREQVACPVRRGGVLAMRPLIVHASSKSHDRTLRRVLHIEYGDASAMARGIELAIA